MKSKNSMIAGILSISFSGLGLLSACGQQAQTYCGTGYTETSHTGNSSSGYVTAVPCDSATAANQNGSNGSSSGSIRFTMTAVNCPANVAWGLGTYSKQRTTTTVDETLPAQSGDAFSIVAQSTCAGGGVTASVYKNGTLLESSSKTGTGVATVSGSY